jgi:ATP-dependent Clp protease ATP-binding subunit ClpC
LNHRRYPGHNELLFGHAGDGTSGHERIVDALVRYPAASPGALPTEQQMAPTKYDNALLEGRELTSESRSFRPTLFRDELVAAVVKSVGACRSVLLVGPSGVGKTGIVQALAAHLAQTGPRKLYELSAVQMLSGTVYLGEWQSKVTAIFDAAAKSKALLYFSDIWNLPSAGRSASREDTVWDALRPRLLNGGLQVVGEVTDEQLLVLNALAGFATPFDIIEVPPLTADQVATVVRAEAGRISLEMDDPAIGRLLELCSHFLPASAGAGPALRLTGRIRHYLDEKRGVGEDEPVTAAFVEKVFAVYSGLPRFVVSRQDVRPVGEIRDWFRSRIIGQRDAIEAVVQMITLFKAGLHDAQRPIGSFLFVGPTGVGKTELARALATYLFGSEKRLLRFDLSEFKDYHSFQMLIGDPEKPERPARLVDPVRAQPFQVVLLDEIEKAHANVWDLLLQVLDDGRLTPARGPAVSFRNTIVIATANVGAQALERRAVGFTGGTPAADEGRLQTELEAVFRPELLNRFQHICRFLRLTKDEVREIARAELRRVLEREGIVGRRLAVDVDKDVLDLVVAQGYDEKYGARALKRQLQQLVIVPIATLLMERRVEDASILRLTARHGEVKVAVLESEDSKAERREAEPLRLADGQKVGREALQAMLGAAQVQLDTIASGMDLPAIKLERQGLENRRRGTDLWKDARAAAQLLETCDQMDRVIERMARLEGDQAEISTTLSRVQRRDELSRLAERVQRHAGYVAHARRELLSVGRSGFPDALLEIRPIGRARTARDLLYKTYAAWAEERKYRVLMIREPMSDDESVMIAVVGPYAYGYLRGEAGHHRLRTERDTFVAKVGVAALGDPAGHVTISVQKALKQVGQYGGRVRSRVEVAGSEFAVQNAGSLAESRELAEEFAPSWLSAVSQSHTVVRRYDLEPFLVRDFLTGTTTGRADILRAEPFHQLLCDRIDAGRSGE